MKLTKNDREAFVNAVMNDVPQTDYDELAKRRAIEIITASYPAPVKAIYDDEKLREYLGTVYVYMPGDLLNFYGPNTLDPDMHKNEEMKVLSGEKRKQAIAREELRREVAAAINACSTLKQAQERLPEFAKYLPAARDGSGLANLPAVANVVTKLTQAG